ncbi:hypothetical protein GCM10022280_14220 [Sphingomonas swuensis]|uniref:Uncharacterized protein n=1 Tax=Sphingomonas swuensis TaxID=977800 RepID=A0ABP7SU41_9SPHN
MAQSGVVRQRGAAEAEIVAARPNVAALAHDARMDAAGVLSHAHAVDLSGPLAPYRARDLDDFVHLACAVYGRQPSVVDVALHAAAAGPVRDWLELAANAFERERLYLVRLTSASGPIPSTPGAAETEAALLAQRHALETLARSERHGCALGAATALVADWQNLRRLFDRAAARVGIEVPACALPDADSITAVLTLAADGVAAERAIRFGAEQLLLQHRSLFDLLEARSEAREEY